MSDKEVNQAGKVTAPEDYHVKVAKVLKEAGEKGLHAVVVVGIADGGEELVASSEGSPIMLNMLNNAIRFVEDDATAGNETLRANG